MEHRKNKRAREYDNDDEAESKRIMPCLENNNNKKGKKRDICGISFTNKEKKEMEEKGCLALGVFDFPWLKDGVIFKYEDNFMDFEDKFLSSLEGNKDTFFNVTSGFDFFEEYGLCEASSMKNIPEAKLVEDVWPFEGNELELEAEELDCIWSSLT